MWPFGPNPFISIDACHYCRSLVGSQGESDLHDVRDMRVNCREMPKKHPFVLKALRMEWMVVGPLSVIIAAVMVALNGSGWVTWADLCFLIMVVAMIGARCVSFLCGDDPDESVQLETSRVTFGTYLFSWIPMAFCIWVIANVMGNYVLT